jgi:hypothetical protein
MCARGGRGFFSNLEEEESRTAIGIKGGKPTIKLKLMSFYKVFNWQSIDEFKLRML